MPSPLLERALAVRVRAVAERLGYRMNARVAELMAQVRRGRGAGAGDRLALVWVEERTTQGLGRDVADGARARAAERGYGLDEFNLAETGGNPRRLADILTARGIPGVVFAPVFGRAKVVLDWPWASFPMAVIGTAEWNASLSRAAHHHYEAMRLALGGLARAGAKRPAGVAGCRDERAGASRLAGGLVGLRVSRGFETALAGQRKTWLERDRGLVGSDRGGCGGGE